MRMKSRGRYRASVLFYLGMAIVALLSFFLYLSTLQHYFVADDFIFLQQFHFEKPAFFESFAYFGRDWGMNSAFYRPLVRVVWAAEYGLFGENPIGWHLVSVLLYSATSPLVYLLTWLLSRNLVVAFLAGLFFSLHPNHCEAVTWIADQSDLLAALFCLAGIIFYVQARKFAYLRSRYLLTVNYSLALGCFILALTCKESAISFFLVPLAYELIYSLFSQRGTWQHLRRNALRITLWQLPFWIAIALYFKLRLTLFGGMGGYSSNQQIEIKITSNKVVEYVRWLFSPLDLETAVPNYFVLAAAILLLSLIVFVWELRQLKAKRTTTSNAENFSITRTVLFSLCWIVLFVLPTIPAPSPRLMYLSTIGVAILTAALLAPLFVVGGWADFTRSRVRLITSQKMKGKTTVGFVIDSIKLLLVVIFIALSIQETLIEQNFWWQASQITRTTLTELPKLYPQIENNARIYAIGLINNPRPRDPAALVFGFPEAVQLAYNNPTLWAFSVDKFPVERQNLDRSYFVEYRDGRLLPRNDIVFR